MLRERLTSADQETANVDAVLRAADRGAELTRRLLAFSRKQALDPTAIDVDSLVSSMIVMLRRSLTRSISFARR